MSWMHATRLFSVLSILFQHFSSPLILFFFPSHHFSFHIMSLWCISSDFVLTLFLVLMLISFSRLILMLLFSFWSHLVSSSALNAFLLFSLFCLTFFFWPIWTGLNASLLFSSNLCFSCLSFWCFPPIWPHLQLLCTYVHSSHLVSSGLISTQWSLFLFWHFSSFVILFFSHFYFSLPYLTLMHHVWSLFSFCSNFNASLPFSFVLFCLFPSDSLFSLISSIFFWSILMFLFSSCVIISFPGLVSSGLISSLHCFDAILLILFYLCLVSSSHFFLSHFDVSLLILC